MREPPAGMVRSLRVAALQLRAHDRSTFMQSLDSILQETHRAASGCDLVVLPEATFPAYVLGSEPVEAGPIAAALDRLREIARSAQIVIVVGAVAVTDAGIRNAAFVIDGDGSIAGRSDKLFLWHFDRRWFVPGDSLAPVVTSLGSLGVLVCADGRLPTIAAALVDRGAELLVMPTAWVTSGRDPANLENVQADLLARVRAYENGVPFVAANKCGAELGMVAYCGKSQIVDARGEVLAVAGERDAQTLSATVELGAPRPRARINHCAPKPAPPSKRTARIAISMDPLPIDIEQRLELLDDDYALSPHTQGGDAPAALAAAFLYDDTVLDPAGLAAYRRAGYALIVWTTQLGAPWSQRIARARALELRLYVVVFEGSMHRAFAVDPDGTIVAGTFDDFTIASFAFDPGKTAQTTVVPGTDVAEGLERIASL